VVFALSAVIIYYFAASGSSSAPMFAPYAADDSPSGISMPLQQPGANQLGSASKPGREIRLRVTDPSLRPMSTAHMLTVDSKARRITYSSITHRELIKNGIIHLSHEIADSGADIIVGAPGFQSRRVQCNKLVIGDNAIVLEPSATLTILCSDEQGAAVAGVIVDISRLPIDEQDAANDPNPISAVGVCGDTTIGRYRADSNGVITVGGLGMGRYYLAPRHEAAILVDDGACIADIGLSDAVHRLTFAEAWVYSAIVPGAKLNTYSASLSGSELYFGGVADSHCDRIRDRLQAVMPDAFVWVVASRIINAPPRELPVRFLVRGQAFDCSLAPVRVSEFGQPVELSEPKVNGAMGHASIVFRTPDGAVIQAFNDFTIRGVEGNARGMLINDVLPSTLTPLPAGKYRIGQGATCPKGEYSVQEFIVHEGETTEVTVNLRTQLCCYELEVEADEGRVRFPGMVVLRTENGQSLFLTDTVKQRFWIDGRVNASISFTTPGYRAIMTPLNAADYPNGSISRKVRIGLHREG
jgi:hypothetical protein